MNSNYKSYNVTCTLNGTANALNDAGRQPNLISCPCECSDLARLLKIEESHGYCINYLRIAMLVILSCPPA